MIFLSPMNGAPTIRNTTLLQLQLRGNKSRLLTPEDQVSVRGKHVLIKFKLVNVFPSHPIWKSRYRDSEQSNRGISKPSRRRLKPASRNTLSIPRSVTLTSLGARESKLIA